MHALCKPLKIGARGIELGRERVQRRARLALPAGSQCGKIRRYHAESLFRAAPQLLAEAPTLLVAGLDEPSSRGRNFAQRRLGGGEYFMMGDNRGQSCDSRDWGPVSRDDLIGPGFAVYWPLTRLGLR